MHLQMAPSDIGFIPLGSRVQLNCTVEPARGVAGLMHFYRGVISLIHILECGPKTSHNGYSITCKKEKGNTLQHLVYMLVIEKMAKEDFSNWTCRLEKEALRSNVLDLTQS